MRVPRLYLPVPLATGMTLPLNENAFNHAVRVLRLKPDAPLTLFNGQGGTFAAKLLEVSKREAWVQVTSALPGEAESPLQVTLAQGISRGEKMDYTLQKAVELGVAAIQPLFAKRSGVDLAGERLIRKIQHWRGIVIG
ncbi:MAG TPA: RsmE family RNA methyltransferase, partial [Candidatus Competibacteraceae bacterium]|nr:RsmE family RNA methyltransferase [Candidatus Competibacteraceae bacterium]